jgi:DNA-binding PadR family transcriptional regulator
MSIGGILRHHPDRRGSQLRHHHPIHDSSTEGHRERYPHRRSRRRAPRGDVRTAVLLLLAEEPRHGYQLMQAIAERSGGRWTPSPGAIYPTIAQLEDEGLVSVTADAGRKLVALTDTGREYLANHQQSWPDPFASFADGDSAVNLRSLLDQLHGAVREVARSGNEVQLAAAADILTQARRSLYQLLADAPEAADD